MFAASPPAIRRRKKLQRVYRASPPCFGATRRWIEGGGRIGRWGVGAHYPREVSIFGARDGVCMISQKFGHFYKAITVEYEMSFIAIGTNV